MPRTMGGFIIIAKDPTAKLIGIMRPLRLGDTWLHSRAGLPVDTLTFVIAHVCIRLARSRNRHVLHSLRLFFSYLSFKKHGNSLLTHSHDYHSFIYFLNETAPVISFAAEYCRTQCFLDKFFLEKQSSLNDGV